MGYNSFYGGRRGASFILSEKFNSYQEMVDNFKQGGEYTTVAFDEYVLINSTDEDNGKVYRRGYDYNNEMGGAIYVGNIIGPVGPRGPRGYAPLISLEDYQTVEERPEEKQEGSYTLQEKNLLPGKYEENGLEKFNDSINWICCSFLSEDQESSYAYVGFTFPYTVIDFEAEHVSAYFEDTLIQRIDDKTHPFYQKMKLFLPQGKHGDAIRNIRIGLASEITEEYEGKQDDIMNNRYVFMCDYYNYANKAEGEKSTLYLGDYNIIKNIVLETDGTLTFSYFHNDDTKYDKKIKWITSTSIDIGNTEGDGSQKVKIIYNTGEEVLLGEPLNYIMRTAVTNDYHLLFLYSDPAKRQQVISEGKNATWDGRDDWEDLGSIKQYNGILIGLNLSAEKLPQLSTISGVIEYLNQVYPSGLVGIDLQGKIVSVTDMSNENSFYAFDYSLKNGAYAGWFPLGKIAASSGQGGTVVGAEGNAEVEVLAEMLPYQGIWFITEE